MAHGEDTRSALRRAYIGDRLTLEAAAQAAEVPLATARNWKRAAREAGEDWDKLRELAMLSGGDMESMYRRIVAAALVQAESALKASETDRGMSTETRLKLMASVSDSLYKIGGSMARFAPETDILAVKVAAVKGFAEFAMNLHPGCATALVNALESYAQR